MGADSKYLQAAIALGDGLRHAALNRRKGSPPSEASDTDAFDISLYSGSAGVICFLLELFHVTKDGETLEAAIREGDRLLSRLKVEPMTGLYDGISGAGFVLNELWRTTGEGRYLAGSREVVRLLFERAEVTGNEIEWPQYVKVAGREYRFAPADIVSGLAGTGLFLVHAAHETDDSRALMLAVLTGRRLLKRGTQSNGGTSWKIDPAVPFGMPNFSHGTAGIAYFLTVLYQVTDDERFLMGALSGAHYLQSIATKERDLCLIQREDPSRFGDASDKSHSKYQLGWCHGPVGTSALWWQLHEATGEQSWLQWLEWGANAFDPLALPPHLKGLVRFHRGPTYCHGLSGDGDFLLGVSRVLGGAHYANRGLAKADKLLHFANSDGYQAYSRQIRRPHDSTDDTQRSEGCEGPGFATGISGVGMGLLHADGFLNDRPVAIRFLDLPLIR